MGGNRMLHFIRQSLAGGGESSLEVGSPARAAVAVPGRADGGLD